MSSVPPLVARIEEQLAESGLQVAVEFSEGALILSGVVDTQESREAGRYPAAGVKLFRLCRPGPGRPGCRP